MTNLFNRNDGTFAQVVGTDVNGGLLSYTPTVTSQTGTITSYTSGGVYYEIGPLVYVYIFIDITNQGSAAGEIIATLPINSNANEVTLAGNEIASTGKALTTRSASASTIAIVFYDASFPGATGNNLTVAGFYQHA